MRLVVLYSTGPVSRATLRARVEDMASQVVVTALQQLEQQLAGLERGKATEKVECDCSE